MSISGKELEQLRLLSRVEKTKNRLSLVQKMRMEDMPVPRRRHPNTSANCQAIREVEAENQELANARMYEAVKPMLAGKKDAETFKRCIAKYCESLRIKEQEQVVEATI